MDQSDLVVKAIGRSAQLGSLYDAYNEKLIRGLTLINQTNLPAKTISSIDNCKTSFSYIYTDSINEKFKSLDIQGGLKASLMAGLLQIEGSANYMSKEKATQNSIKSTIVYNIKTKTEEISFSNDLIKEFIILDVFETAVKLNATHVVCGIEWGASAYATFEKVLNEDEKEDEIKGNLKFSFKKLGNLLKIGGDGSLKINDDVKKNLNQFSLTFQADCVPKGEILPTTASEMVPFMSKMPKFIERHNNGKGIQIQYYLFPIKKLKEIMKFSISCDYIINNLNTEIINKLEQVLDDFTKEKQNLNQFQENVNRLSTLIDPDVSKRLSNKKHEIEKVESNFKCNYFNFQIKRFIYNF